MDILALKGTGWNIPAARSAYPYVNCRRVAFSAFVIGFAAISAADAITISINDKAMPMNTGFDPVMSNGRVLVPLRTVMEELAATVTWHESTKDIVVEKEGKIVKLFMNSATAETQSGPIKLDTWPRIYKGKVYVPLRFVAQSIGAEVNWDPLGKRVAIKTFQDTARPGSGGENQDSDDAG
jgi:hypothetical protein